VTVEVIAFIQLLFCHRWSWFIIVHYWLTDDDDRTTAYAKKEKERDREREKSEW